VIKIERIGQISGHVFGIDDDGEMWRASYLPAHASSCDPDPEIDPETVIWTRVRQVFYCQNSEAYDRVYRP
jgi:hypothetical protein